MGYILSSWIRIRIRIHWPDWIRIRNTAQKANRRRNMGAFCGQFFPGCLSLALVNKEGEWGIEDKIQILRVLNIICISSLRQLFTYLGTCFLAPFLPKCSSLGGSCCVGYISESVNLNCYTQFVPTTFFLLCSLPYIFCWGGGAYDWRAAAAATGRQHGRSRPGQHSHRGSAQRRYGVPHPHTLFSRPLIVCKFIHRCTKKKSLKQRR